MKYDRTVFAYHGCEREVAEELLSGKADFLLSENDYDWLGSGIYFWEYGLHRARRWAEEHRRDPAVVGAFIQLGNCFDLLDTRFSLELAEFAREYFSDLQQRGEPLPENKGRAPDFRGRFRDCALMNAYLRFLAEQGIEYDTVRCAFIEGKPVYERTRIFLESHIQLVVRRSDAIIGLFRPR